MKFSDQFSVQEVLTGKCPVSPALEGGVKGHNIKGKYLTGKPRPLGRGFTFRFSLKVCA